jgi:hypothetical protein
MGQDFSTGGRIGVPIVSISKGKLYRVQRVWASIGNAVFVQHNDGMISRYGHLSKFSKKVTKALVDSKISKSYKERQDFDFNLRDPIDVEEGEIIAYSGDSGIGPPHLHLEIFRDNVYYNPKDYGLGIDEGEDVLMEYLHILPEGRSFVNGEPRPFIVKLQQIAEGVFKPEPEFSKIKIQGNVSLQIMGYQKSNNSFLGYQSLNLYMNSNLLQGINFDKILKHHSRKSVLLYDGNMSKSNGVFVYNLYAKEGNDLMMMSNTLTGSGMVRSMNLYRDRMNEFQIKAKGMGGREAVTIFNIERDDADYSAVDVPTVSYNVFFDRYSTITSTDKKAELFFPAYSVFSKGYFTIEENTFINFNEPNLTLESKIYTIGPEYKEFNLGYDIYVKLPSGRDFSKAGLYEITNSGKVKRIKNATLSSWGNFFKARLKRTGHFAIVTDNSPPTLELFETPPSKSYVDGNFTLKLKVSDIGSGFFNNSLIVKIDDQLGLAEINPNTGIAEIFQPQIMYEPGIHNLEAFALDRVGNRSQNLKYTYEVKQASAPPPPQIIEDIEEESIKNAKKLKKKEPKKKTKIQKN